MDVDVSGNEVENNQGRYPMNTFHAVGDVNGDGLPDVIGSLAAHGYGLAWWEQVREGGAIIHDNGLAITIAPNLVVAAGNGVATANGMRIDWPTFNTDDSFSPFAA